MLQQPTKWHLDERVPALLSSIKANPPKLVAYAHGAASKWVKGQGLIADQQRYDPADERVEALSSINNEHFAALAIHAADKPLYNRLSVQFIKEQPTVDALIEQALASDLSAAA